MCEQEYRMPMIGEKAPKFEASTTMGPIKFPKDYKDKWVIFFSHPADFTPVCTTEFMTFANMHEEFRSLNCELLGLSIDSTFSHIAWVRTIEEKIEYKDLKNLKIGFPIVADLSMEVSKKYGMLQSATSATQTVRAVFIIDPKGIIRSILYYPMNNGRNMQEIKRLLIAMQTTDEHEVATPANWQPGDEVIVPPPKSSQAAEERVANAGTDYELVDWFLSLKKCPQ
jgi:peroxiredoxin (alkyl hydroperoxide reductase subunit C)